MHVRVTGYGGTAFAPAVRKSLFARNRRGSRGAEFDHWYARHRNRAEETWLVCGDCNQRLESSTEFKGSGTERIRKAYQAALRPFLECGQGKLFAA
jgi:hypothetical protein